MSKKEIYIKLKEIFEKNPNVSYSFIELCNNLFVESKNHNFWIKTAIAINDLLLNNIIKQEYFAIDYYGNFIKVEDDNYHKKIAEGDFYNPITYEQLNQNQFDEQVVIYYSLSI